VATAHPTVAGKKRYVTECRLLVGNGRLDVLAGETCDPGVQPAKSVHAHTGWTLPTGAAAADIAALWKTPPAGTPRRLIDRAKLWKAPTAANVGGIG